MNRERRVTWGALEGVVVRVRGKAEYPTLTIHTAPSIPGAPPPSVGRRRLLRSERLP